MIVIGLAGPAGAGKDSVADHLVKTFGFVKFAFSDALYAEVQHAFGLPDQELLRNRATKETPSLLLSGENLRDDGFISCLIKRGIPSPTTPLSPRQVLQWWGTEYRRAQNPNYWLNRAEDFITGLRRLYRYPEHAPQYFVECGTRFENEREWIKTGAHGDLFKGSIWHIHRDSLVVSDDHASAQPLPVLEGERQLWNNDTLERLQLGVELMMTSHVEFVRVEPMEAYVPPEEAPDTGNEPAVA